MDSSASTEGDASPRRHEKKGLPVLAEKPLVRNILILISRQGEGPLLPVKLSLHSLLAEEAGANQSHDDRYRHANEAIKQETRIRKIAREKHGSYATDKAHQSRATAYAREEDAHEEQAAQTAREQT